MQVSALPKLKLQKPPRSCRDELAQPKFGSCVPDMAGVLDDVGFKVQQLLYESLPVALAEDEMFALVAYTYDSQSGQQAHGKGSGAGWIGGVVGGLGLEGVVEDRWRKGWGLGRS